MGNAAAAPGVGSSGHRHDNDSCSGPGSLPLRVAEGTLLLGCCGGPEFHSRCAGVTALPKPPHLLGDCGQEWCSSPAAVAAGAPSKAQPCMQRHALSGVSGFEEPIAVDKDTMEQGSCEQLARVQAEFLMKVDSDAMPSQLPWLRPHCPATPSPMGIGHVGPVTQTPAKVLGPRSVGANDIDACDWRAENERPRAASSENHVVPQTFWAQKAACPKPARPVFGSFSAKGIFKEDAATDGEPVIMHCYDSHWLPALVGLPVYHVGVEVFGMEVSFGDLGVRVFRPGTYNKATHREVVTVGYTPLKKTDVVSIIKDLAKDWPGQDYRLLGRNCQSFVLEFCLHVGLAKECIPNHFVFFA